MSGHTEYPNPTVPQATIPPDYLGIPEFGSAYSGRSVGVARNMSGRYESGRAWGMIGELKMLGAVMFWNTWPASTSGSALKSTFYARLAMGYHHKTDLALAGST